MEVALLNVIMIYFPLKLEVGALTCFPDGIEEPGRVGWNLRARLGGRERERESPRAEKDKRWWRKEGTCAHSQMMVKMEWEREEACAPKLVLQASGCHRDRPPVHWQDPQIGI